jgi:hypothetical protein
MLRREMLNEDERHAGVGGNVLQQSRDSFETAGGGPNSDNWKRAGFRWDSFRLVVVREDRPGPRPFRFSHQTPQSSGITFNHDPVTGLSQSSVLSHGRQFVHVDVIRVMKGGSRPG